MKTFCHNFHTQERRTTWLNRLSINAVCSTCRDEVDIAAKLHDLPTQTDEPVANLSGNQGRVIWSTMFAILWENKSSKLDRFIAVTAARGYHAHHFDT